MSIDPLRLVQQQQALNGAPKEYKCPGCGQRARDRTGTCSKCRRAGKTIHVRDMKTDQLVALMGTIRQELARRAEELADALEVKP